VRIVHAEVPETSERQRLIGRTEIQMKQFPSDKAPDPAAHLVDIPEDVQAILSDYSDTVARKDFDALLEFFSKNFRSNGYTREQGVASIRWTYLDRPIHQYKIILTRFDRQGNKARVDGFVQRKGFRTPFKPTGIAHIAKEADGRWRLYGNQNF
jgi:hypothetical protein